MTAPTDLRRTALVADDVGISKPTIYRAAKRGPRREGLCPVGHSGPARRRHVPLAGSRDGAAWGGGGDKAGVNQ